MKKKEPQNLEKVISRELAPLRKVKSLVAVTLVTFDVAIPADEELLNKFPLEVDGWKIITSKEIEGFLTSFKGIFGKTLEEFIGESKPRLGGSVFMTQRKLLELRPEIVNGACFAPSGKENGTKGLFDDLVKEVNRSRISLQEKSRRELNGRFFIQETVSEGIPPLILSFYQEKGRSMVLIRDNQKVKVEKEILSKLEVPHLLLLDARELTQESYLEEGIRIARNPENFVVLGLGTESIMPQLTKKIKLLHAYTQGETGFAGNRREVEALLSNWGGVDNLSELMLQTNLRFLLETNGQNGAILHFRVEDRIHSAAFAIPKEEVFKGDTTNAGDIFLAYVIDGLMSGSRENESIEDWLYRILESASKGTLGSLQERAKDSKGNGKD